MYACNDKEQFIGKTKLEYIDKLTKCINDNNESLNTSTLLITSNLKQYYESNVITEKEKEKIRNNFLIDTEKYTQEKIERLKNNFGNFSNLGYENQIKGLLETVIVLVKTTQEYEILDSVLNKHTFFLLRFYAFYVTCQTFLIYFDEIISFRRIRSHISFILRIYKKSPSKFKRTKHFRYFRICKYFGRTSEKRRSYTHCRCIRSSGRNISSRCLRAL